MEFNSKNEKEYYKSVKEMLKDDGIIDDSERDLLDKRKEKYAISDTRAKELEDFAINERLENKKFKVAKLRNKNIFKKEYEIKEYKDNEAEEVDYEILKYKRRKNKNRNISLLDRINYYAKNKRPTPLKIYTFIVVLALEIYLASNCMEYINNAKSESWFGRIFNYFANSIKDFFDNISGGAVTGADWMIRLVLTIVILLAFFVIFYLLLIYLPAFMSLMGNRGKERIKRDINLSTIFVSLALIIFSYFFVKDNNKELNEMRKNVNTYIKNENYIKAYEEIKKTKDVTSIGENVRAVEYQKLLDAITNKLNGMNKGDAGIMSVYKKVIEEKELEGHEVSYNQAIDYISKRNFNNYINGFITQGKYSEAYDTINKIDNNLELQGRFQFLFIDTKGNEIKEIKKGAFDILASAIYSDFGNRVNSEMDKVSYDFINNQIISVYNKIPKDIKNRYKTDDYENELDKSRDKYLKKLIDEISNISNPSDAIKKLDDVYHNSKNPKKDVEKSFLIFFTTNPTYKEYWEKVKKEYEKALQKNKRIKK
ncbi:hypothetical protein EPJ66_09015 [Brachyspira aalborgi]|uniref:Uncharacterized protein n=1 Tax=Brachyspira aalborgi TaxID=29522 RepID=A0A5C8FKW3_9SPIR|nr:tripartite tricarboxylate transporter TctB family protein [Brachyspira aalborgi]TXJ38753.1 hypothetical protein EPJ81_06380 [Brachyspira aalborgi]TXJ50825.1 hypothetical protein EPJ66_09015 [Brachyspira aalborgi]